MTLSVFRELVSEEIANQVQELEILVDFELITSSRENYLLYLEWLASIWVYLETQIEASPLVGRRDLNIASKFRSPLIAYDLHALLGEPRSFLPSTLPTVTVFDDTLSLGTAAGALYAMEDLPLDHKRVTKRLSAIGIRGKSVTQFYRGSSWAKSRRSLKLAAWINDNLTARERAEAVEGAHLTIEALVTHFTRFRTLLQTIPTAAAVLALASISF